jgi:hypothetical protein
VKGDRSSRKNDRGKDAIEREIEVEGKRDGDVEDEEYSGSLILPVGKR